jgi:DNA-binding MarR family transcriptional regulator
MTQASKLPFGTALALAQRTLSAPLAAVLSAENVTMPQWFTLNTLGLRGSTPVEVLSTLLATNGLDAVAVRELLETLRTAGLADTHDGIVSLTPAGTTRYAELRERIDRVTDRIFDRFDAARVATAHSLLQEIAEIDPEQLTRQSVREA